jgi:tRNA A-37 threonylcarbamoyl transferase component Bud32/TolB-like protein
VTTAPAWPAVEALLDQALDLAPAEQDRLLEQARSSDPALAAAVAQLIEASRRADGFLDQPASAYLAPLVAWVAGRETLAAGATLGRYEILSRLGAGATAAVYLARDPKHHREVAVKVLHSELARTVGPERFLREIEIAATLHHPHILPLFDSGTDGGHLFYVMPRVEGESLRARLRDRGKLPADEAIRIAGEVAGALDYSHRRGVVHRDIKPENILLQDGQAIVADFGIARAIDAAGAAETGGTGTPAYMSPEQRRRGAPVDARTDVYALGCVLYEMLAGEAAFAKGRAARPPLAPPAVDRAVARAMAESPEARFATAGTFAEALGAAARPAPALPARRKAVFALGAGLVAAAAISLAVFRPAGPEVVTAAARVAVLPFEAAPADSGLARLGEDLASTLSLTLDGVGGIATVDRVALLARAARERRPATAESALELGRRYGAGSVLRGTLRRQGGQVRAEATLLRSDAPVPIARAAVVAPAESLPALTDSLVWTLLRQVWLGRAAPTPSLSGITTGSIPALRAFLDGEHAMLGNRWTEALDDYRAAYTADTAFALAFSRYAEASAWSHGEVEPMVLRRLAAERHRLPERDRLLADERLADTSGATRLRLLGEITRRYPDYWPGGFFYGEALVHFGVLHSRSWSEGRAALRRALAASPDLLPAWEHLGWISTGQDTAAFGEALEQRRRLGYYDGPRGAAGLRGGRLLDGLGRSNGVLAPGLDRLADSVARDIVADTAIGALETELGFGFPAAQTAIDRRVLAGRPAPELRAAALRSLALSWAARGAWDSALAAIDRYAADPADPRAPVYAYSLTVLGAWLRAIPPTEAERHRAAAHGALPRLSEEARQVLGACLHWHDGVLAFVEGNPARLAAAREALLQLHTPDGDWNARGLAAYAVALEGRRAEAGKRLAALEWEMADHSTVGDLSRYDLLISRISAAGWLAEAGDREQAIRLLRAADAKGSGKRADWYVSAGPAQLMLGRLLEARGDRSEAAEAYRQFLRRVDLPGAGQRAQVREAEAGLARVGR